MSIHKELEFAKLDDLNLDPQNPRLGRNNTGPNVKQERILQLMQDWKLIGKKTVKKQFDYQHIPKLKHGYNRNQ